MPAALAPSTLEQTCGTPARSCEFNQRNDVHAVSEHVSSFTRIDHHNSIRASDRPGAIRIDGVKVGASIRLHSTPMRRPFLNKSKSISAP